jgi:hypothetical protein
MVIENGSGLFRRVEPASFLVYRYVASLSYAGGERQAQSVVNFNLAAARVGYLIIQWVITMRKL